MSVSVEQLVGYVPAFVQRWLTLSPEPSAQYGWQQVDGAVLFADITGFTPLAQRLAEFGPEGAEQLDAILNAFYSRLVDVIAEHGGDVACYAGDAAIALFPAEGALPGDPSNTAGPDDDSRLAGPRLRVAVQRAAQLGLELQQRLRNFRSPENVQLSMKIGIGAGRMAVGRIGGVQRRWRPLLVGAPLEQIGAASDSLAPGEVVLTAQARRAAEGLFEGETLAADCLKLRRIVAPPSPAPLDAPRLPEAALSALRCYVPQTVLSRLDAGHAGWLADLRQLSVLFVKLGGIDVGRPDALPRLHDVMQTLQQLMLRYEGEVLHLIQDDKGLVVVACLGLPPWIHEDDADRAVGAALRIKQQLHAQGVSTNIGIATGRIFSGPRGNDRRREYSITGLVANLAARLMGKAHDDVLCDEPTSQASRGRATFEALPPIPLKGIDLAVPAFRAVGVGTRSAPQSGALVGREEELQIFATLVDRTRTTVAPHASESEDAAQPRRERILWVEGEPGVGKSALLAELCRMAQAGGSRVVVGACDAVERATPYYPWRSVFSECFQLAANEPPSQARQRVLDTLAFDSSLADLAPLLNAVLPLELPETQTVLDLDARARADNLHELLLRLLERMAEAQPLLILLDDAHWLDSASRRLLQLVAQRCGAVTLAVGARPPDAVEAAENASILDRDDARKLVLDVLPREQAALLCCRRLNAERISPALADFLYQRTQGNPFYIDELTRYLQDVDLIERHDDGCRLRMTSAAQESVPNSIRALITHRVDRLPLPEQLTLRTATVIGRTFPQQTLSDVYQDDRHRDELGDHLDRFTRRRFIELEIPEPDLAYAFRHITIQQVTYDQMPLANRRQLHRRIGQWYEDHFGRAANYFPLLAHHYGRAGAVDREIEYLVKSGESALRNFANLEAVRSFEAALVRHAESHPDAATPEQSRRLGHWRRQLGEAHFYLGNLLESQLELEAALELFGRPAARGTGSVRRSIVWQVLRQTLHRILPRLLTSSRIVEESESEAGGHQETALTLQRLSQIHYLKVDILEGLERAMRALNVAERAGLSPLLARAYSGMGLVVGMLRRRGLAEMYARLSEQTARQAGHRPTLAYVLMATGVYRLGVGRWEQVRRDAEESIAVAEQLGDQHQLGDSITLDAMRRCFLGEYESASRLYERIGEIGRAASNELHEAWGYSGLGECLLRQGRTADADRRFREALRLLADKEHLTEEIRLNGLLALASFRQGDVKSAEQYADATMRLIDDASYTTVSTLEGFSGATEVLLALWSRHLHDPTRRRSAERACGRLAWYAKVFPIGWPRWYCHEGVRLWLLGRRARAVLSWRRALRHAVRLEMPLETALIHLHLAGSEAADSPAGAEHLHAALPLLERLGAVHETEQVRALLADAP
ncbi:MAG: AAA family ATPase [Pirellulaceae bacterium]